MSMQVGAGLSISFWGWGYRTAAYFRNRTVSSTHGRTPFEVFYGRKPGIGHMQIFRSHTQVLVHADARNKTASKSEMHVFVGYGDGDGVKGYRLFNPRN